ncbi:hypothetical protein E4U14_000552, partial [Claviceps sp. LM454 group G7]
RDEALRDDFHLDATYDGGDENEWDDNEDNWNGDEEEAIDEEVMESKDENKAYLEFLNEEAQKYSHAIDDADDDELGEDNVLLNSALDKIEPYQLFKATLMKMQQERPQFYANLASHLSVEEQNMLQSIIVKADEVAAHQAQQALQQAQAAAGSVQ